MSRDTIEEQPQIADEPPRPTPPRMTFEEYLTLDGEHLISEWVDGEVIFMSPAAEKHQEILAFLLTLLKLYVEAKNLGRVLPAPFAMRLAQSKRGREPDLLYVKTDRLNLIKRTYLDGPADLAIEIMSPESIGRDRGEKFVEYEQAGIKEYWLIDPDRQSAEFYELGADGRYRAAQIEPEGVYRSQVVPGFFVRVTWLWRTPAPTLDALRELRLI